MRHMAWYVIWLDVLFTAVIWLLVVVGRGQPLAENVRRLHLTDCAAPCWIGIKPGLTTEGGAQKLFSTVYPQQKPYFIVPDGAGGGLQAQTNSNPPTPSDLVMSLLIGDLDGLTGLGVPTSVLMPRLGDMLLLWGLPACVYHEPPDFWRLRYNNGRDGLSAIDILMKGKRLSPDQPINLLIFYRTPPQAGNRCLRNDAAPWFGFARLP